MIILKLGKIPGVQSHDITCPFCGTCLRVEKHEGKRLESFTERAGIYFKCPLCNRDIWTADSLFDQE